MGKNTKINLQIEQNEKDDEYTRKLINLVDVIRSRFPQYKTNQRLASEVLQLSGQALGQALRGRAHNATVMGSYLTPLIKWLKDVHGINATYNEMQKLYTLVDMSDVDKDVYKNEVVEMPSLNFASFINEVLDFPGGADIKIIGTWPTSIVGRVNDGVAKELRQMIQHSKSVRMVLPKIDGDFFGKRLYKMYNEDDGEFIHRRSDLEKSIKLLTELKHEFQEPEKEDKFERFDFKVYDDNPGMRLFSNSKYIYTSMFLDNIETPETFGIKHNNDDGMAAKQLLGHFDKIWETSTYTTFSEKVKYNLLPIESFAGIYKVYTYGHTAGEAPSTIIGSLLIEKNGKLTQRTYINDGRYDENLGRSRRVGNNLFMEVRNQRAPKFTALTIVRMASGFSGDPKQILFGTLIVPKRVGSKPVALRVILERQAIGKTLDDIKCQKVPLSDLVSEEVIPVNIRKILSGVFRNMLRYHDDALFNETSLENEFKNTRVKLGVILYAYAKILKMENGSDSEIVNAIRWALTHGFTDWPSIEDNFMDLISTHPPTFKIFERIKKENLDKRDIN